MFKRLLVTTDGSESSLLALPHAEGLARAMQSEVLLLYVVQTPEAGSGEASPDEEGARLHAAQEAGQRALDVARKQLQSQQDLSRVTPLLIAARFGDVATTITRVAEEQGADLIVMAPTGTTGNGRALMGCIAERVLARASMPVLLVKPGGQTNRPELAPPESAAVPAPVSTRQR